MQQATRLKTKNTLRRSHNSRIREYYQATDWDYRNLWTGWKEMALHFGYFDREARTHRRAILRMNAVLADAARIESSDHVLDAGCGYGGSATWLALNKGCRVTGVTLVPRQATIGQVRANSLGVGGQTRLLLADYAALPFADHAFTAIWGLESLCHANNIANVLGELRRVLAPRGKVMIADCFLRESPRLSSAEMDYIQPWIQGMSTPTRLTLAEFRQALVEAGFDGIEYQDYTAQVGPSLRRLKHLSRMALPGARVMGRLGYFHAARVDNVSATLCMAKALELGLWRYGALTGHCP